jgi:hypothetical protein
MDVMYRYLLSFRIPAGAGAAPRYGPFVGCVKRLTKLVVRP